MATTSTFLPPYLNTIPNKRFLNGTLDLLTSAPQLARFDGFIGRQFNNGKLLEGSYLLESTAPRQNYQLEPAFVTYDSNNNITNISNFIDLLNTCANKESITSSWNRLLTSGVYSWKGFTDTDKIINYQNYCWMGKSLAANNDWYWTSNIAINDISTNVIGKTNYTTLNGIKLLNGMIVSFNDTSEPAIVEGIGEEIILIPLSNIIIPTFANDQNNPPDYITINRSAVDLNLWSRSNLWVHKDTLNAIISILSITNNSEFQFAVRPILEFIPMVLFGHGKVGLTPATYYDAYTPDAISIIQGTTNFTVDGFQLNDGDSVIFAADKNQTVRDAIYDVNFVDPSITTQLSRLYPVQAATTSNIIAFGSQTIDGYITSVGDRILAVNQSNIPNGIYIVTNEDWKLAPDFISINPNENEIGVLVLSGLSLKGTYFIWIPFTHNFTIATNIPVIQLTQREIPTNNNCVLITSGNTYVDNTVSWGGSYWKIDSQIKTAINQSPLFDVFDLNNISFSNISVYPESSFAGSKLFSYEIGVGPNDPILGMPLTYGPIGNLNDVIFNNNYFTDSFSFTTSENVPESIVSGRAHIIDGITKIENVYDTWQYINSNLELYQNLVAVGSNVINFTGKLLIKSTPNAFQTQVFVDGIQLSSDEFSVAESNGIVTVTISSSITATSLIFIKILCSTPIANAWYDVPPSFESNSLGENLQSFSMSDIRNHATTSNINSNNTSDIINLQLNEFQGTPGSILFNESLSILPTLLLTNNNFDIDQAIKVAGNAYIIFKQKLINVFSQISNIQNLNNKQAVDQALQQLALGYTNSQPWNTSDMCFWGGNVQNVTISSIKKVNFNLQQTYIWDQPNYLALQVYLNCSQLINNIDYYTAGNILTITHALNTGDNLSIYEIPNTTGSFIPATPTKLGLSAAYVPQIYVDNTYQIPRNVLQGHDGSITECFNDYRDNLLLDYEIRVYNNLKVNNQLLTDIIQTHVPQNGRFRNELAYDFSPYSPSEQLTISQRMFFEWAAQYNINYTNFYDANNMFTWNWSSSLDKFSDSQPLLGYWRGIYNWFYDSENPNTRPWEMLNISVKPAWWDSIYGPGPYTGGNLILWNDIANGIIRNPSGITTSSYGIRYYNTNSVLSVIPVDSYGILLNPNQSIIGTYNDSAAENSFVFGDSGPVETAWKRSSIYPFSKLRSKILQNPLFMLGTLWDTNNYLPTVELNQFRFQNGLLGSIKQVALNSVDNNGLAQINSILNYSIEYLRNEGKDPSLLRTAIDNTNVNLVYNLGGYADANNLTVLATPNNPNDVGAAELISNEDYSLFLNESSPVGVLTYSGIIITTAANGQGYQISGYDKGNPYFMIYPALSFVSGPTIGISPNLFTYPKQFDSNPSIVSYNTIFGTQQEVINFIAGYEQFLISNGLNFNTNPTQDKIDYAAAALQFVKWSLVNWNNSQNISLIINPAASIIEYDALTGTLHDLTDSTSSLLLDVNGNIIDGKYLDVFRDINTVTITHQGGGVFSCIRANIINYEHRFTINNISSFNDTIYDPITGNRQLRLKISGQKTANWTGSLDFPGFLICTNQVNLWNPNQDYLIGSIVQWKNSNYVATTNIIGSSTFQYSQFSLITTKFTNSILPNLSLKATDYSHAYDPNYRPYINDLVSLRNNTIGYIERDWLNSLNIDLSAQSNFYRGWIKEKGTLNSLNSYSRGSTPGLNTQVILNEEYAMKVGEYGSDSRTGYGEVSLPPTVNSQNPLVISFVSSPNSEDTTTTQIVPFNLYEKSINWTNDFIQNFGNLKATTSSFESAGPVIPSRLITQSYQNIPGFEKSDEDSLFFSNVQTLINSTSQNSIIKIAENNGSFWLETNQISAGPNQWDIITFSPAITNILSITQLNPQTLSFNLTSNINAIINSVIIIDHVDPSANISIQGSFIVSDYFLQNGYANLIVATSNNILNGNIITYNPAWNSTSIYTSKSLRSNSIAESNISLSDTTRYVDKDNITWAEYELIAPYTNQITYPDVAFQLPITSVAYDDINQLLWSGKPSAIGNNGLVELRQLTENISSTDILVSVIGGSVYDIETIRPDTALLGSAVVCANGFAVATATSSNATANINNIGQIYIIKNNTNGLYPEITQILSADAVPAIYLNGANFGKNLAISDDGNWLYVVIDNFDGTGHGGINAYQLKTNANASSYTLAEPPNNTLIKVTTPIFNADSYSITVTVSVPNEIPIILIPHMDYSVNPFDPTDIFLFGNPIPNIVGTTVSVEGLSQYYAWVDTLVTPLGSNTNFGASISCDATGEVITVGAPDYNNGAVIIYRRIIENLYNPTTGVYTQTFPSLNSLKFELSQILNAPNSYDSQFGASVAIQNNQLLVGSPNSTINNKLNKGVIYCYSLDTQVQTQKNVPVANLTFPILPFRINNWITTNTSLDISSLLTNINSLSNYSGVTATLINSNIILTINETLHTSGLTPALIFWNIDSPLFNNGPLFSEFTLTNTLYSNSINSTNFGQNIKWIASDLFGEIENIGFNQVNTPDSTDGTYYDGGNTNFNETTNQYSQNLKIYQVLKSNRSWIHSNSDLLQPIVVFTKTISGINYPSIIYAADITNLFVIDSNNPTKSVEVFNNENFAHGWTVATAQEFPIDSTSISRAWIYDSITNIKLSDLEIVDLNAGILPGAIASDLDFICDNDPANYNTQKWNPGTLYNMGDRVIYNNQLYAALFSGKSGSIFNSSLWELLSLQKTFEAFGPSLWGSHQKGMTWFKTNNLKTVNAQLGNISERAANWNTWFPNSNIEVYEWVTSSVPPNSYISNDTNGFIIDINCPYTFDNSTKIYGFWVYNKSIPGSLHTVSTNQLISSLSDIQNSGIPMITAIDNNVISIWNINQFISNNTAILHIDYVVANGNNQLHNEFALISNDGKKSWYKTPIYSKFIDSLSGMTDLNQLVPDITLPINQQTGILINPQQSIFVDRIQAANIYFTVINQNLSNLAVASSSVISLLSASDPIPTTGFLQQIPDRDVLNELNINDYPEHYKILLTTDDLLSPAGWSIVEAINGNWEFFKVQLYNLTNNWKYADWFSSNYVKSTPMFVLNNIGELPSIVYNINDIIQINTNGNNNKIIYKVLSNELNPDILELNPIFIQNGTIQFLSNIYDFGFDIDAFDTTPFDDDPYIELRMITQILNDYILTGSKDLTTAADDAFYAVLQYVIHENKNLDWLFKTSFITVNYINRNLNIQGSYEPDNQSIIEDFVNESTPFHTRIRAFYDTYTANDYGNIGTVDFDLPAQYDENYANIVLNYSDNVKPNGLLQLSQFGQNVGMAADFDSFYITSTGIPIISQSNDSISQDWIFGFKQHVYSDSINFNTVPNNIGPIASAIDGVPFYSANSGIMETLYQTGNLINSQTFTINTVWLDQQNNIDTGIGLPNELGICQYLSDPYLLYNKNVLTHSPLLGYAWDGVPIYGPYGYVENNGDGGIFINTSSYKLLTTPRLDKTGFSIVNGLQLANYNMPTGEYIEDYEYVPGFGSLDQNNGRYCTTPEYPLGTYAYFISVDSIFLKPVYPYVIGPTYYGIPYGLKYSYVNGISTPVYQNGKVALPQINIANSANFIRTPDGSVSSDSLTLQKPIYAPWNDNYINNSQLIRHLNTTIRFDRVNKEIEYLTANTSYPAKEVLFNSNSGIFMQSLVANANSANIIDANIWGVANSMAIATSTAMNRITAEYSPSSNMFANQARLLMDGIDYSGVIVKNENFVDSYSVPTGSLFDLDDSFAANTSLNISWRPGLITSSALSSEVYRFGNSSGAFNTKTKQYISANLMSDDISALSINSSNFTLEFFVNFSNLNAGNIMVMVDTRDYYYSPSGLVIYKNNGNLCLGSNTSMPLLSYNLPPLPQNEWQFITAQGYTTNINGNLSSNLYMYLNGQLINSIMQYYNFSDSNLTLGADVIGGNVCCGYMDEIRLTKNINRYDYNAININVPSSPFPRENDPYLNIIDTPLLFGFESFNNEGPASITFNSINSQTLINDLSWNTKTLELVNYNAGNVIVDSSLINNQNFSVKLNQ